MCRIGKGSVGVAVGTLLQDPTHWLSQITSPGGSQAIPVVVGLSPQASSADWCRQGTLQACPTLAPSDSPNVDLYSSVAPPRNASLSPSHRN
jgi:hypothetical protein